MPTTRPPPTRIRTSSQSGRPSSPLPPVNSCPSRASIAAPAHSTPWTSPVRGWVRLPMGSESGTGGLSELGEAVAQTSGLVSGQAGDGGGGLGARGVQRDARDAEGPVDRTGLHVYELHPPVRY